MPLATFIFFLVRLIQPCDTIRSMYFHSMSCVKLDVLTTGMKIHLIYMYGAADMHGHPTWTPPPPPPSRRKKISGNRLERDFRS